MDTYTNRRLPSPPPKTLVTRDITYTLTSADGCKVNFAILYAGVITANPSNSPVNPTEETIVVNFRDLDPTSAKAYGAASRI